MRRPHNFLPDISRRLLNGEKMGELNGRPKIFPDSARNR